MTTQRLTPGRVVALALIGLLAAGLGYVRFGGGSSSVSVPAGAHAGDLILHRCHYGTEQGSYDADCGTLVVPENRADAKSRLIALPVTRIRARTAHPAEPIFRLEGGPGISNMHFSKASRFAGRHDVVLVGYRGVDGSVRLDCPEVESALRHSKDFLGTRSLHAYSDAFGVCAARLTAGGVDLAGYGLTQQVDDMEAARKALGYGRIDLLSESAGTRTAMIYAWRYPKSIHRSVMIGVNPPGNFLWDPRATDEQIHKYAALCAKDSSCSSRTTGLAGLIRRTSGDIPGHWMGLPIKKGNVEIASFYGLVESTPEAAPISAPMTLGSWISAAKGDASGFWLMSLVADMAFPKSFVWGQMASAGRIDAAFAKRYFSEPEPRGTILGDPGTRFIWGGGGLAEAWPANANEGEYARVRTSQVPTLLVGGDLDFATPPQIATRELLPYLPNGRQVILPGFGHSTSFWTEQRDAGSRLINAYLDRGVVDRSLYKPQKVDFMPDVTQTALGKGIAGGMAGFVLITVLSLLWMPLRVHRRGRFGRVSGAILRSLYPVVLGFGGWFAGVLIVTSAMPGTPLDDELLAAVSIGAPVGLGIYWAWLRRDAAARLKTIGLAAALGGALVGAWLGFNASGGLLALVTTIAGALAGANLTLLGLDIAWGERAPRRQEEREPAIAL